LNLVHIYTVFKQQQPNILMTMKMKAQAAMEYLMTYGWAILIVIIVAAALYAFGIFNPATWTGTRATGFANIGVPADWRYGADGDFNITVKNAIGSPITITGVKATCGTSGQPDVTLGIAPGGSVIVGAGSTAEYYISNPENTTYCAQLTAGSSYSTQVKVTYTKSGGAYTQTDAGTVTGTTA